MSNIWGKQELYFLYFLRTNGPPPNAYDDGQVVTWANLSLDEKSRTPRTWDEIVTQMNTMFKTDVYTRQACQSQTMAYAATIDRAKEAKKINLANEARQELGQASQSNDPRARQPSKKPSLVTNIFGSKFWQYSQDQSCDPHAKQLLLNPSLHTMLFVPESQDEDQDEMDWCTDLEGAVDPDLRPSPLPPFEHIVPVSPMPQLLPPPVLVGIPAPAPTQHQQPQQFGAPVQHPAQFMQPQQSIGIPPTAQFQQLQQPQQPAVVPSTTKPAYVWHPSHGLGPIPLH